VICPAQVLRVSFGRLYDTIAASLPAEWSCLVLYTLLHGNPSFKEWVYARSDADVIVLPILESLYKQTNLQSSSVYMSLILLLILSQVSVIIRAHMHC